MQNITAADSYQALKNTNEISVIFHFAQLWTFFRSLAINILFFNCYLEQDSIEFHNFMQQERVICIIHIIAAYLFLNNYFSP